MKKARIVIKRIILGVMLIGVGFLIVNGVVENIQMEHRLNEFIAGGECGEVEKIADSKYQFCKVSRETYLDGVADTDDFQPVLTREDRKYYVGSPGDIALKRAAVFNIPLVWEFITYFVGGHAAIISSDKTRLYEATGVSKSGNNAVIEISNDWFYEADPIYMMRVKGATDEQTSQALETVNGWVGTPYNYTFIFNTENSFYCTDLVTRAWEPLGFYLNDGFASTVNDILLSDDAYYIFYKYRENNVYKVYYLD